MKGLAQEMAAQPATSAGFDFLDAYNRQRLAPQRGEAALYGGRSVITNTVVMDTPESVTRADRILTNPTTIEPTLVTVGREIMPIPNFRARSERRFEHLGTTTADPYALLPNRKGKPYLTEFAELAQLPGEDARRTPHVRMKGHLGVHVGELVSTVVATPKPGNPQEVETVRQVFWWAPYQTPHQVEQVGEGPLGMKNTTLCHQYTGYDDTTLIGVGRPKPHMSFFMVGRPEELTPEAIGSASIIPGVMPADSPVHYHFGANYTQATGPGRIRIDAHQAHTAPMANGRARLHYRLAQYGYELPSREMPHGRVLDLGGIVTRNQFPPTEPKPPEGSVGDFYDVVYGAYGSNGTLIAGASDTKLVLADVVHLPK